MKMIDINLYGKELYSRKVEAVPLNWADCGDDVWKPIEKECHSNVSDLCLDNSELKPIRGWLMFDNIDAKSVRFIAHSVVQYTDGNYYDITPPNTVKRPPFIIAKESEIEFEKIVIKICDFTYIKS
jgi:hypothetical protein